MKEKCWVVVDKDGTEKISNSMPMRRQFNGRRILSVMWGCALETIQKTIGTNGMMGGRLKKRIFYHSWVLYYQKEQLRNS